MDQKIPRPERVFRDPTRVFSDDSDVRLLGITIARSPREYIFVSSLFTHKDCVRSFYTLATPIRRGTAQLLQALRGVLGVGLASGFEWRWLPSRYLNAAGVIPAAADTRNYHLEHTYTATAV